MPDAGRLAAGSGHGRAGGRSPTRDRGKRLAALLRTGNRWLPAVLVCSISALATLWAYRSTLAETRRHEERRLQRIVELTRFRAESLGRICRDAIAGAEGLVAASERVTRDEWEAFARRIGVAEIGHPIRQLLLVTPHRHGDNPLCGTITFAFPRSDDDLSPGRDADSLSSIREAMRASAASRSPVCIQRPSRGGSAQDRLLIFDSLRKGDGQAAWVVGVVEPRLVAGYLESAVGNTLEIELSQRGGERADAAGIEAIPGTDWILTYATRPEFYEQDGRNPASMVLLIGFLATTLLGWIFGAMSWTRSRAEVLARRMTEALVAQSADLQSSEERYRAIVECQRDLIVRIRPDFTLSYVNEPTCALSRLPREALLGTDFLSLFDTEAERRRAQDRVSAVMGRRDTAEIEVRLRAASGDERWIHWSFQGLHLDGNEKSEVQAIGRDVTEQKRAEIVVHSSLERLSMAQRLGRIGSLDYDPETRTLDCTEEIYRLLEIEPSRSPMTSEQAEAYFDPRDLPRVQALVQKVLNEGTDEVLEPRLRLASGKQVYFHGILHPVRGSDGAIERIFVTVQDITGRRMAEETLKSQAMLLDLSFDAIMVRGLHDGTITYWNRGAERLYGWTAQEAIGSRVHDLLASRFDLPLVEIGARLIQDGRWEGEVTQTGKDGRSFIVQSRWALVRDDEGTPTACMEVNTDISARKRAEEKERLYRAQIEEAHAYAEGQARELAKARDAALVHAKAKSEFLANMSHEIRTPMNGVIGMAGLLMETDLTPEQREYASTLGKSAEALLVIVNDVLDYSKMEAGRLTIHEIPFDPADVVEDVAGLYAPGAFQKGVEMLCDMDAALPASLRGDSGRIRQVLANLTGNAVKFTHAGHVILRASCRGDEAIARTILRFEVEDTGIGVPEERQDAIFDSFTQADGSTTRQYGGTGLGLTICRRLVDLMGGTIGLTSRAGRGSIFWFELPLEADPATEGPGRARPDLMEGCRVLVIEDHPEARASICRRLAAWGIAADGSGSIPQAIAMMDGPAAAGAPYDAILLDDRMPGWEGPASLRAILGAMPSEASPAVVLMTTPGATRPPAEGAMAAPPFRSALMKPLRIGALREAMEANLGCNPERASGPSGSRAHGPAAPGMRVLIAEDHPTNQMVLRRMMERLGCRVTIANDGSEAVALVGENDFDLVFLDVHMPVMDGIQACLGIRSLERSLARRRTPIAAMTADAMPESRAQCLAAGMDYFLTKPIRQEDLARFLACIERDPAAAARSGDAPGSAAHPAQVFDPGRLADACGDDEAFKRELMADFLGNIGPRIDSIEERMLAGDAEAAERGSHACKGSSRVLGAEALGEIFQRIESAAGKGDLEGARQELPRARQELDRLREALELFLRAA